jgi:hypothetical protein
LPNFQIRKGKAHRGDFFNVFDSDDLLKLFKSIINLIKSNRDMLVFSKNFDYQTTLKFTEYRKVINLNIKKL